MDKASIVVKYIQKLYHYIFVMNLILISNIIPNEKSLNLLY